MQMQAEKMLLNKHIFEGFGCRLKVTSAPIVNLSSTSALLVASLEAQQILLTYRR